jgi:hypothetical protein
MDKGTILPKDKLSAKVKCKSKTCIGYDHKHRCVDLKR